MNKTTDTETDGIERLTDKVGVMGLDGTDYPEEDHVTTVGVDYLKSAMTILDELGWKQVDICAVPSSNATSDYPLLVLRTPFDPIFGGANVGISIAPKTDKGRTVDTDTDRSEVER